MKKIIKQILFEKLKLKPDFNLIRKLQQKLDQFKYEKNKEKN